MAGESVPTPPPLPKITPKNSENPSQVCRIPHPPPPPLPPEPSLNENAKMNEERKEFDNNLEIKFENGAISLTEDDLYRWDPGDSNVSRCCYLITAVLNKVQGLDTDLLIFGYSHFDIDLR